ncbi:MAG: hypothetical protein KGH58_01820 [Candidatus Micrarchaeota archaeon]|nr:hypothetical protein [Candidatus Micrarchaeota archaeon]
MIPIYYGIAFLAISVAASLAALAYCSKRWSSLVPLAASMLASLVASYSIYGNSDMGMAYMGVGMASLAAAMALSYVRRPLLFIILLATLASGFVYGIAASSATIAIAGMFAIGTISGLLYNDLAGPRSKPSSFNSILRVEVNRDVVHILIGLLVVAIMLLLRLDNAAELIFFLILLGYALNDASGLRHARRAGTLLHSFYRYTSYRLERLSTTYGIGAVYLAAGVALLVGFVHSINFLLFSVVALLFADPVATIIGVRLGGPRLPHNGRKSFAGTLAFFVVAGFLGYLAIGLNAFIAAAILATVESLEIFVDDNIRIAVVCTAIYLLAYL